MTRFHVNLAVDDIERSVAFYSSLFDAEPVVQKDDYAKWLLDDPQLNFSIAKGGHAPGIRHLGLQADSREEMARIRERVERSRGKIYQEGETTCCYAASDKTWVTDDQGVQWETFYTHGTSDSLQGESKIDEVLACCKPTD